MTIRQANRHCIVSKRRVWEALRKSVHPVSDRTVKHARLSEGIKADSQQKRFVDSTQVLLFCCGCHGNLNDYWKVQSGGVRSNKSWLVWSCFSYPILNISSVLE